MHSDCFLATEINVATNAGHNMNKPQSIALHRSQTQRSMYHLFHLHEIQEQAKLICGFSSQNSGCFHFIGVY